MGYKKDLVFVLNKTNFYESQGKHFAEEADVMSLKHSVESMDFQKATHQIEESIKHFHDVYINENINRVIIGIPKEASQTDVNYLVPRF